MRLQQFSLWVRLGLVGVICALGGCSARYTGPWDLERLNEVPDVQWVETSGEVRSLFYTGEPYQGQPTRVFAYCAVPHDDDAPSSGRKVPAMVLVHGGGGTAFKEWVELWAHRGYAAIAMDLSGRGPDGNRLPDGGPDQQELQKFHAIQDGPLAAWPYHAVSNVIRAHSLLRSFPEVDSERTGITGISWGGYLTCIVAGLDHRLKVAVPVYGCGFLHENSAWIEILCSMSTEDRENWIASFEPSGYLKHCRAAMLFINGTNDFAYPLDSWQASYRLVPGPTTLCVKVRMAHSHPDGWAPREIGAFVESVLRDGEPLPRFSGVTRNGPDIVARFDSAAPVIEATLNYTVDACAWKDRHWHSEPARLSRQTASATLPGNDITAWFINVTDHRGLIVSTPHEEMPQNKFTRVQLGQIPGAGES